MFDVDRYCQQHCRQHNFQQLSALPFFFVMVMVLTGGTRFFVMMMFFTHILSFLLFLGAKVGKTFRNSVANIPAAYI